MILTDTYNIEIHHQSWLYMTVCYLWGRFIRHLGATVKKWKKVMRLDWRFHSHYTCSTYITELQKLTYDSVESNGEWFCSWGGILLSLAMIRMSWRKISRFRKWHPMHLDIETVSRPPGTWRTINYLCIISFERSEGKTKKGELIWVTGRPL